MKTVLVVDDEWVIASVLEDVLVEAGYRVVTAANGRAGLERVAEARPDLILVDYMMPLMNGAAMLAALASDPALRAIPTVLMTSLSENTVKGDAHGYVAYLQKPFLDVELLAVIEKALSREVT